MRLIERILQETVQPQFIIKLINILEKYPYCFVGGFAVAIYSKNARKISPEDIDLKMLKVDFDNLKKELIAQNFKLENERMFQGNLWIEVKEEDQSADIAIVSDPLSQREIEKAKIIDYQGTKLKVISPKYLIIEKLLAGRQKDRRDIIYLLTNFDDSEKSLLKKLVGKYVPREMDEYNILVDESKYPIDFINKLYAAT